MPHLYRNGTLQCVTTLVTFQDAAGKPYVILGRPDPRYRDWEGKCLDNGDKKGAELEVGEWQFIGGHAEFLSDEERALWDTHLPHIENWPQYDDPRHPGQKRDLNRRIITNGLKELAEEAGISGERLEAAGLGKLMDRATLRYLTCETNKNRHHILQDVHYLHLDLGCLTNDQAEKLCETIRPHDDMLEIIVAPADQIHRDTRNHLALKRDAGHLKTKEDFGGFPEMKAWNRNYDAREELFNCQIATLEAQPTRTDEETAEIARCREHLANIDRSRTVFNRIHCEKKNLEGINRDSLEAKSAIGMHIVSGHNHGRNGELLEQLLMSHYGFVPTLMPSTIQTPFALRLGNGPASALAPGA